MLRTNIDWLRLTRVMTQYVVPGLLAVAFLVELTALKGRDRLQNYEVISLLKF